jgi:predicted nucleic acid-binding protein
VDSLTGDALATGKALFRQHKPLSFVDGCIVGYMRTADISYLYSLDDDFDAIDDIYRLETSMNLYDPE